jgi:hypothetical protein
MADRANRFPLFSEGDPGLPSSKIMAFTALQQLKAYAHVSLVAFPSIENIALQYG